MKILVLGAGVVGVTTAYQLSKQGHDVIVVERRSQSASECSYANGGQLSYSHVDPWANPVALAKVPKWLVTKDSPLVVSSLLDHKMWSWAIQFLACCNKKKALDSSQNMMRLALYSRECLKEIEADIDISYNKGSEGILHIFKCHKSLDTNIEQAKYLKELGCDYQLLDSRTACEEKEPAFKNSPMNIVGGIHYPMDEKGDIFKFTTQLSEKLQQSGKVEFRYNTNIKDINVESNKIISVSTDHGELKADSYVICLGARSSTLLDKIGVKVPIYPMKGYSISIPIKNYDETPTMGITDQSNKIVYSKLGNVLRVAGTAEFAGYDDSIKEKRINTLKKMTKELFPNCGDFDNATSWSCLRPSTPDGSPIIGRSHIDNLYLNTGHGTLGWTMSFASAKAITDIIGRKEPAIDLTGLDMRRFA